MPTSIIITNSATSDGSMIVTYSCNDKNCDHRLAHISKKDYSLNEMRPIYIKNDKLNPIGYIPQVEHTYAYFDGNNIVMNEHNLTIINYSNKSNHKSVSINNTSEKKSISINENSGLFCGKELSSISVERCKTSKDAVNTIIKLIDTYGVYSNNETLLIADENEAWILEICDLKDNNYNRSCISKQIPDGKIFIYSDEIISFNKSINYGYKIEDSKNYSFLIKSKNKLSLSDVFSLYRDSNKEEWLDVNKSLVNSYYTYICQVRPSKPDLTKGLIWLTPSNPYTSCFVPIFSKLNNIPLPYTTKANMEYNSNCAFWTFKFVDNLIKSGFDKYIKDDICDLQRKLEIMSYDFIIDCDNKCIDIPNLNNIDYITSACEQNISIVLKSWLKLALTLINNHKNNYSKYRK